MNTSICMMYELEMRHPFSTICGNDLLTFVGLYHLYLIPPDPVLVV